MKPPHDASAPEERDPNLDADTAKMAKKQFGAGRSMSSYLQPEWIETILPGYPEKCRPSIRALAKMCREQCGSDHKILSRHSAQAGFSRGHEYFYGLFRGTYKLEGDRVQQDVVNLAAKLKAYYLGLRAKGDDLFAVTERYKTLRNLIKAKLKPHATNKLIIIVGPTGSGKSAMIGAAHREFGDKLNFYNTPASERSTFSAWLPILCQRVGAPASGKVEIAKETAINQVQEGDILAIDDAHRLYREGGKSNQPAFNYIQRLHDETGAVIIVSLTQVLYTSLLNEPYFEQFIGRAGGEDNVIILAEFHEDDDVIAISERRGLVHAEKHLDRLLEAAHAKGRLRVLIEALNQGRAEADDDGKPFSFDYLEPYLPAPKKAADSKKK